MIWETGTRHDELWDNRFSSIKEGFVFPNECCPPIYYIAFHNANHSFYKSEFEGIGVTNKQA